MKMRHEVVYVGVGQYIVKMSRDNGWVTVSETCRIPNTDSEHITEININPKSSEAIITYVIDGLSSEVSIQVDDIDAVMKMIDNIKDVKSFNRFHTYILDAGKITNIRHRLDEEREIKLMLAEIGYELCNICGDAVPMKDDVRELHKIRHEVEMLRRELKGGRGHEDSC
jgi:ethanolamine ammonia-lyase large subunit